MADTTITANVRKVAEAWPGITQVNGQSKVRDIAGTDTVSEHVFGNALDIYGSRKAMSTLAAHLNQNKQQLGVRIVCYDGGPGPSYDKCTTEHLDHIHTDMVPNCAGIVSTRGSASERRDDCERHQQGGNVNRPDDDKDDTKEGGDGFLGIPGAIDRFTESIEDTLTGALFVAVGIGIVGAGVVLAIKDTQTFKTLQGVAKTAVTKGVA